LRQFTHRDGRARKLAPKARDHLIGHGAGAILRGYWESPKDAEESRQELHRLRAVVEVVVELGEGVEDSGKTRELRGA
jgi:hypothetical protein